MADSLRICRRTGCPWPAAASLSFRYASRQVWLLDLVAEAHPSLYDLCPEHADGLRVPLGWQRVDQRSAGRPAEPAPVSLSGRRARAGAGSPVAAIAVSGHAARSSASRYAALAAELPRLAAELGVDRPEHDVGVLEHADCDVEGEQAARDAGNDVASGAGAGHAHAAGAADGGAPLPTRELAPLPVEHEGPLARAQPPAVQPTEVQGQLRIPGVRAPQAEQPGPSPEPPPGEARERTAVIVSIERAGGRRR